MLDLKVVVIGLHVKPRRHLEFVRPSRQAPQSGCSFSGVVGRTLSREISGPGVVFLRGAGLAGDAQLGFDGVVPAVR